MSRMDVVVTMTLGGISRFGDAGDSATVRAKI
jgi:hypothetical protein